MQSKLEYRNNRLKPNKITFNQRPIMGFIQEWFGFNGWKELSARGSIVATIFYRVFFAVGLGVAIIAYSFVSGGEDPSLLYIAIVGIVWFLIYQFAHCRLKKHQLQPNLEIGNLRHPLIIYTKENISFVADLSNKSS